MSQFDKISPPEKVIEQFRLQIEQIIEASGLDPKQIKKILEDIATKQQSVSERSSEPPQERISQALIHMGVPETKGSRTSIRSVGQLNGRWVGDKEFLVEFVKIDGILSRRRVSELAQRMNFGDQLERALSQAPNDDPIYADIEYTLAPQATTEAQPIAKTRIRGEEQEFDSSLVPQINTTPSNLQIKIDRNSRPFRLIVRA